MSRPVKMTDVWGHTVFVGDGFIVSWRDAKTSTVEHGGSSLAVAGTVEEVAALVWPKDVAKPAPTFEATEEDVESCREIVRHMRAIFPSADNAHKHGDALLRILSRTSVRPAPTVSDEDVILARGAVVATRSGLKPQPEAFEAVDRILAAVRGK